MLRDILHQKTKLGMLVFIGSEATFFLFLIVAYGYFNYSVRQGPTAAASLNPVAMGGFSIALLSSSVTMEMAIRSLGRPGRKRLKLWLGATIVLGATFLFGEGREYEGLLRRHITPSTNLFSTSFFTLTGFHGLHVFFGLLMIVILLGFAAAPEFDERRGIAAEAVSYYWHFVDVMWVFIFSMVYLWSALAR